jgi:hypothetical protein
VKKLFPEAAFLHLYFNPDDPEADAAVLKERFGDAVLLETKYVRSGWLRRVYGHEPAGTLPAVVATLRDGSRPGAVDEVLRFCERAGIRYQNPHTAVLEDTGLFPDPTHLADVKEAMDPYNILNPDKLRSAKRRAAHA